MTTKTNSDQGTSVSFVSICLEDILRRSLVFEKSETLYLRNVDPKGNM